MMPFCCLKNLVRYVNKMKITFESPSPTNLLPIMQDDADEVIDLIDDSKTTLMQHHVYCPYNNNDNQLQFLTHLFMNIAPEWVEALPQDRDGMKIYKMKCLPREWVQKSKDLRHFKMHSSRRKGQIGTRKVGRCICNLYCPYGICPFMLSAGGKRNVSNFQNVYGYKICFSC